MGSIFSFEKDLKNYDTLSLSIFKRALEKLEEWDYFRQEYEGTNMFLIVSLIDNELYKREKKEREKK